MKKITVSAPGKLMLLGEHAVIYNEPCLVTAVNSRLLVTVEGTEKAGVEIDAPQVKDTRFVEAALKIINPTVIPAQAGIQEITGSQNKSGMTKKNGIKITTQSPFSGKYGFGSSSAVTVATLFALSQFFQKPLSQKELFDAAYKIVLDIQKTGSGFDLAAAIWGGTILFKKGGVVIEPINVILGKSEAMTPESLLSDPAHFRMTKDSADLVVCYSGVKANTVDLINQVGENVKTYPQKGQRIMTAIGGLVDEAKMALSENDWEKLGKLMNFNQEFLRDLGVSTEKLENLISAAKSAGAYGAKLSGAGGGDCMIALVSHEKKQAVAAALTAAGGEVLDVVSNEEGVRIEV